MSDEKDLPLLSKQNLVPASCNLCSYYSPDLTNPQGLGICRRKPPIVYLTTQGPVTVWPSVRPMDWCGEGNPGVSHDSRKAGEMILKDKGNGNKH